ncbi:MAG TPA: thiamine pyrophosphate-binding protein [Gaiellaceae bacterium]|nr:thiamine pyrophosphate-binding protein [Gaiellaceae bacterium]
MSRTGGQVLVDQLELHGVDTAFCVPGESYLAILDALHDSPIRLISCRHEAAAANMAEAYGKLTGRPGICLVTRGPGATHASVGVHIASQDSTPMILLVGQVPRASRGRDAFQELDYSHAFGGLGLAKWAAEADAPERLPELVSRAFSTALGGRPGPVVLALPEDMLEEETDAADGAPGHIAQPAPTDADLARLGELLAAAERPLAIVGEGGWTPETAAGVLAFCETNRIPVASSFRCQDFVDNRSSVYAGHLTLGMDPKLAQRVEDADLILALGGRLGEVPTKGYTLLESPRPRQTLVHAHPDPDELGRVYEPELPIVTALPELATALGGVGVLDSSRWSAWTDQARADYEASLVRRPLPGELDLGDALAFLRSCLPDDAVLACGAGNFTVWIHRYFEFRGFPTQLSPRAGAMGYGLPAALTALALDPGRPAVCLAGDGDFMMSAAELATAVQYGLNVIVLVVNNGMYGTIRMHQERLYPGRVVGTELVNPDFADFARSFGCHGETVGRTAEVEPAFERAVASGKPAVIDLRVDPDAIHPRFTIAELRGSA